MARVSITMPAPTPGTLSYDGERIDVLVSTSTMTRLCDSVELWLLEPDDGTAQLYSNCGLPWPHEIIWW